MNSSRLAERYEAIYQQWHEQRGRWDRWCVYGAHAVLWIGFWLTFVAALGGGRPWPGAALLLLGVGLLLFRVVAYLVDIRLELMYLRAAVEALRRKPTTSGPSRHDAGH